jgi:hypothetical protein
MPLEDIQSNFMAGRNEYGYIPTVGIGGVSVLL